MSKQYHLNRVRLTGKLNEFTPSCVVLEVLQAHNISIYGKINSLTENINQITVIEKYRTTTLFEPLSSNNLRYIATFINYESSLWTKSSLLEAYERLTNFDRKNINNIVYGQLTHDNLNVYNATMLYILCKENNIQTTWNMTPQQMVLSLKQLSIPISTIREQIISYTNKMNRNDLINLINNIPTNLTDINLTEEEIEQQNNDTHPPLLEINPLKLKSIFNKYKDTSYLLKRIIPKSHNDAIILASLIYNLNLVDSKYPYQEYLKLRQCKGLNFYTPIDIEFRKKYLRNPDWFNLNIFWEPALSFIYDEEGLRRMCSNEGYELEDFRNYSPESLLQISRISNNVYLGKHIYEDVDVSAINMTDLKELDSKQCLTIGNIESKFLHIYTFDELVEYFTNEKEYRNPVKENEILSKKIINKLKLYATKLNHTGMLEVMEMIHKWKQYSNEFTDKLRTLYNKNTNIVNFLNKLIEIGMYMRGWKVVCDSYPLRESQTKVVEGAISKIEVNFVTSTSELYQILETYTEEEKKILSNLPLMRISVTEDVQDFIVTPDKDDGSSILDRLRIVSEGDKHKNMKSCIRVTSNILLVTAYFYICSLGLPKPYNLNDLDHIT